MKINIGFILIIVSLFTFSCIQGCKKRIKENFITVSSFDSIINEGDLEGVIKRAKAGNPKSYDTLSSFYLFEKENIDSLLPISKYISDEYGLSAASRDVYFCMSEDSLTCEKQKEALMYLIKSKVEEDITLWSLIEKDELINFENGNLTINSCY